MSERREWRVAWRRADGGRLRSKRVPNERKGLDLSRFLTGDFADPDAFAWGPVVQSRVVMPWLAASLPIPERRRPVAGELQAQVIENIVRRYLERDDIRASIDDWLTNVYDDPIPPVTDLLNRIAIERDLPPDPREETTP